MLILCTQVLILSVLLIFAVIMRCQELGEDAIVLGLLSPLSQIQQKEILSFEDAEASFRPGYVLCLCACLSDLTCIAYVVMNLIYYIIKR